MSNWTPQLEAEFQSLLIALLEDELSAEQRRDLNQILREYPPARDAYLRMIAMHTNLSLRHAESTDQPATNPPLPASLVNKAQRRLASAGHFLTRPTPLSLSIAAVSLCCFLGLLAVIAPPIYRAVRGDNDAPPVLTTSTRTVARIVGTHEAQFKSPSLQSGQFLLDGERVELAAGLVEIHFHTGEQIVLDGPAIFTAERRPERENCGLGRLDRGKLTARVPVEAAGFTIETPTAAIVDLGTEFGVIVTRSGTDVAVFRGRVEARVGANRQTLVTTLGQGQSVHIDPNDVRPYPIELAASEFTTALPATARTVDPYVAAVSADRPVGYWRLNDRGTTLAVNRAGRPHGLYHGDVEHLADSRPGNDKDEAPRFDGVNDYVEIKHDVALNSDDFTLEAWVKLNRLPADFASAITSRDDTRGTAGYTLYATSTGQWELWTGNGSLWSHLKGPAGVVGEWTHVAATFQRIRTHNNGQLTGIATLYLNGEQVAQQDGMAYVPQRQFSRPLRLGAGSSETNPPKYFFPGQLAEVAIYDRALDASEIQSHVVAVRNGPPADGDNASP